MRDIANEFDEERRSLNKANPNRIKDASPMICGDAGEEVINRNIWWDPSGRMDNKPIKVLNPCILNPGHEGPHKYVGMNR